MSTKLRGGAPAPESPFPLLPLRTGVLFPGTVITLPVGRPRSVAMLRTVREGDILGVVAQREPKHDNPTSADLHAVGTFARIANIERGSNGEYHLSLEGIGRFSLAGMVRSDPFWLGEGSLLPDLDGDVAESIVLAEALKERVAELAANGGSLAQIARSDADPGTFADQVAGALGLPTEQEVRVLAEVNVPARLRMVAELLTTAKEASEVKRKIESEVRKELGKGQREAILREQMRAIQKELGDDDKRVDELSALKKKLDEVGLSEEARTVADRELRRLEGMNAQSAEHGVVRNYLELIAELPWSKRADAKVELDAVAKKLDEDHFGLVDVKKRVLEHMAVMELAGKTRASILCLAGPPGVGKTSLGQSIADATGRPLVRVSLGGVGDEAELRGHRRTYVGALPGRVLHAMKKAKVKNPVILFDEVDKLGSGWRGSPEAALLEILDPEQSKTFVDHYLEIPYDLSEALFICTANDLGNLSAPLRDRLEIIELSGYTLDEKLHIAKSHLVPKQLKDHAIPAGTLAVTDGALSAIIRDYTREAGVRQLDREIGKLCRSVALQVARAVDHKIANVTVEESDLVKPLGKTRFFSDVAERTSVPGVATGLAWTPVGGDILFIETSKMVGKGRLEITGQLGDVMKESAKAALTYVRSHAEELGVDAAALESLDLHIHVPAGGVPKDGPSAGVTMFTALTSLLTGRKVRSDTAMTGEATLRGRVLPVGGIKAKVLAAHRAGITRVVLPAKNRRDLDDVPQAAREVMEFIFTDDMASVIKAALEETSSEPTTTAKIERAIVSSSSGGAGAVI